MTELSKNAESNNLVKPLLQAVFLVPYVPYYLQIFEPKYNEKYTLVGIIENELYCKKTEIDDCFSFEIDENTFPILRPLSDFYDINAPAFIDTNFDISTQLFLVDLYSKKQHYSGIRYSDMQEFLREHIDVFNLIEQDLAVSIHDVKTLNELGAECRRIEKELYPETDEEIQAKERYKEIELVLRMVEVGFNGKKVYYKIDKALELFRKKKGKFDLKDAAKIIADANRLFNREVSE